MKLVLKDPRALLRPSVWSNFFFLIPLYVAARVGSFGTALIIALVIVASTLYHALSEEGDGVLLWSDRFFALLLTLTNAGLIIFGGFTYPYFQIVVALTLAGMYFYGKQWREFYEGNIPMYEQDHTLWHLFSAIVTLFSLFAFYM